MTAPVVATSAERAAVECWDRVRACLDEGKHFLLEAGAGAGKTYSLIEALRYLIQERGHALLRQGARIACITYTNVATREIEARTDAHPAIYASTIHSFCWTLIQSFPREIRALLREQSAWLKRIGDGPGIEGQPVEYSLGYPRLTPSVISLGHNDVIAVAAALLGREKFRRLVTSRFPVIFIDEYQDTDQKFVEALKHELLGDPHGPQIGFFGDHLQAIYANGCGAIEHERLVVIDKGANFRSTREIVGFLNRIRPELRQEAHREEPPGSVSVYHTNSWSGTRRNGGAWTGDLPAEAAHAYLELVKERLTQSGWAFGGKRGKILMLTHNILAAEQGYDTLAAAFDGNNDAYVSREDPHIAFLVDTLEPALSAFEHGHVGAMFACLNSKVPTMSSAAVKARWHAHLTELLGLRASGTIGEVVDAVRSGELIGLPDGVVKREQLLKEDADPGVEPPEKLIDRARALRLVPYHEVRALGSFLDEQSPFSTKHGVKGAEFENVLVVFGRGWSNYNFNQFLEWDGQGVPAEKNKAYARNRNLFYVACSRPRVHLAMLFTQQLSDAALATLSSWVGTERIHALPTI